MTAPARLCVYLALGVLSAPVLAQKQPSGTAPADQAVDLSQPLTLERAVQIGLAHQNTLGIAQTQVEAARARVTQARAAYFPSVGPSYDYSSQLSTFTVNGQRVRGTVEQSVTQVGASLMLFDMGKREANVLASRYGAKAAAYNVLDSRQAVIVNVTSAYYDLLRRHELVRVADSSVQRAQTTLEATRAYVEAGTSPAKDTLQAEADLGNAQVQQIQARNDVLLSETSLKTAMGVMAPVRLNIPDQTPQAPPTTPDTRTVAEYTQQALANRPDLKRDAADIDASRHNVKIAQINAGFQINASVNEGYRIDPNPGENRSFVTSFSYPLFDAGLTRAQVRQAKASLEQARLQLELSRQNLQASVEQAYLLREESRARITAANAAAAAARTNYDAARESQKEGAGNIIDVITAQNQLVTAETNAVQAIYDYYTADAQLQRSIGANDPYLAGGQSH